jgi:AcrR family transcriptional regulator
METPSDHALPRGRPRSFDRDVALDRAMELFWRQGYETTSIGDLTRALGIAPPSLYAAFGDKEHLFLRSIERYQELYAAFLPKALDEEPTGRQAIGRLLHEAACMMPGGERPPGCMVVLAAMNCSAPSENVRQALAALRSKSRDLIEARLRRAADEGELPAGTDPAILARYYSSVFQGLSIQARDGATADDLKAVADLALAAWPS